VQSCNLNCLPQLIRFTRKPNGNRSAALARPEPWNSLSQHWAAAAARASHPSCCRPCCIPHRQQLRDVLLQLPRSDWGFVKEGMMVGMLKIGAQAVFRW